MGKEVHLKGSLLEGGGEELWGKGGSHRASFS